MKKNILTLADLTQQDFFDLFELASDLKQREKEGIYDPLLAGKVLGLLFDKHSTRTRVSFESAMYKLGGDVIYMNPRDTQIGRSEPAKDTARVLSGYIDALVVRTYSQELIEEYATYADIPVINALSDLYHPCQILSDLFTILEIRGNLDEMSVAWVGDGNNVAHSWLNACAVLGFNLNLACPAEYQPETDILKRAQKNSTGNILVTTDPEEAVQRADVIYTDVWASMGQEEEHASRQKVFEPFQVNQTLVDCAAAEVLVMHCLPAHRGEEIAEDVLEGKHSVVWQQAENKMHLHKALLKTLLT